MDYTGDMKRILKTYFGHNSFLMGQKRVIESILEGRIQLQYSHRRRKIPMLSVTALIFPVPLLLFHPLYPL